MTQHQARTKAHDLWGNANRYGVVVLRRKSNPARYQVGYQIRADHADDCTTTILGTSCLSWEDAFSKASVVSK